MMDLQQHLLRQMAFSHATYGPGRRTAGLIDHIGKELAEIAASDGDPGEWVDVVILALDGLTRELAYPAHAIGRVLDPENVAERACLMILDKQARNEAREWPDWRTADPNRAIEHVRGSAEGAVVEKADPGCECCAGTGLQGDGETLCPCTR